MSQVGKVVNIQHFSVNDGEGIRTTVFLEGCPLKCKWCCNPDSWNSIVKLGVIKEKCTGCKKCIEVCPRGITSLFNRDEINKYCNLCGKCKSVCLSNAISIMTREMTVKEVIDEVEEDRVFYISSGGGVTISGGEATVQEDFLRELVNEFYNKGIDITIETCGYFKWDKAKDIFDKVNHVFIDIKTMDDNIHKKYTGVSNKVILENIKNISKLNKKMTVRIPVIPQINDSFENIKETAQFIKANLVNCSIELLPYHKLGTDKYRALGLDDYINIYDIPDKEAINNLEDIIRSFGVEIVDYK